MTLLGHIAVGIAIAGMVSHAAMDYLLFEYRVWPFARYWPWRVRQRGTLMRLRH